MATRISTKITSVTAVTAFLVLASALLFGCGDKTGGDADRDGGVEPGTQVERELPLKTLAQGATSDYGRLDEAPMREDAPPEGLVITDDEEYQLFMSMAGLKEDKKQVDFDQQVVIAAMQGPKNTGGYAISIMRASQSDTHVWVEVEVVEPEPGSMTVQALTSPYHIVTAERPAFDPQGELVFTFVDQNDARFSRLTADI